MVLIALKQLEKAIQSKLSQSRYEHSLAVARLAHRLAKSHGLNMEWAYRVGLVHDCAKEFSPSQLLSYVKRHRLRVPLLSFILKTSPNLLHAFVGAHLAFKRRWVNKISAKAISSHTLGNLSMSDFDRLIYVADFAAYDRSYRQAKLVRKVAFDDLNKAFRIAMKTKIKFSLKRFHAVHPTSIRVWNRYCGA